MNANPFVFLFLVLPFGISAGFVSVTLPYFLTKNGFSVGIAATITALGLSANIWRFVWAPLIDLTLSLHKWYLAGVGFCAATLLLLCLIPFNHNNPGLLSGIVLLSQIAATFVVTPVSGLIANTVTEDKKGRAGGWYQAGSLGGMGLGGGAGVWLGTILSYQAAGVILSITILGCAIPLFLVPRVNPTTGIRLKDRFKSIYTDIKELIQSKLALFTITLILMPIGIGAAAYIWSSAAADWHASAKTVAMTTGVLSGISSALGCVAGGFIADKLGRWWLFFGGGVSMALVAAVMAYSSFTPTVYVIGVLFYAFTFGLCNTAFSAIILHAIGKGAASTKYALVSSIGNFAPVYLLAFDGYLHDKYSMKTMLLGESFLGIAFTIISLLILSRLNLDKKYSPQ